MSIELQKATKLLRDFFQNLAQFKSLPLIL